MEVQRWLAVPTDLKKTADIARERYASGMTIVADSFGGGTCVLLG
jgi:hypothetical protein